MSIVIAKKVKGGVILGADSGCFSGQKRTVVKKAFKLEYYEDVYVGGVGTLAEVERVEYMENLIDPNAIKRNQLDKKSIVQYAIPHLKKQLDGFIYKDKEEGCERWNSEIIIVRGDKAFAISSMFTVKEIDDFMAIGAPEDFCDGAYALLKDHPYKRSKDVTTYRYGSIPEERLVVELIKMTIEATIYTYYPIRYINTATDKDFQVIYGGFTEYDQEVVKDADNG